VRRCYAEIWTTGSLSADVLAYSKTLKLDKRVVREIRTREQVKVPVKIESLSSFCSNSANFAVSSRCVPSNSRRPTDARTIATDITTALGLFRTPASIATPCSVKNTGRFPNASFISSKDRIRTYIRSSQYPVCRSTLPNPNWIDHNSRDNEHVVTR